MNKNEVKLSQLTLNTNDQEQFPNAQVTYMGKVCDVTLIQPYGLIGRAPVRTSLVTLFNQQGSESARLGIASCPQLRKKGMVEGEVGLQNVVTGCIVTMDKDGNLNINVPKDINATVVKNINITAVDVDVTVNDINVTANNININASKITATALQSINMIAPKVNITGDVNVTGKVTVAGAVSIVGNVATLGTLTNNGVNVGSTHKHGGVQTGGGNTLIPH